MKFVVVGGGGRADGGGGGGSGYRIKNKNPTQSCGEESPHLQECPGASTWFHVMLQIVELRTLLGSIEKTDVVAASGYAAHGQSEKR